MKKSNLETLKSSYVENRNAYLVGKLGPGELAPVCISQGHHHLVPSHPAQRSHHVGWERPDPTHHLPEHKSPRSPPSRFHLVFFSLHFGRWEPTDIGWKPGGSWVWCSSHCDCLLMDITRFHLKVASTQLHPVLNGRSIVVARSGFGLARTLLTCQNYVCPIITGWESGWSSVKNASRYISLVLL